MSTPSGDTRTHHVAEAALSRLNVVRGRLLGLAAAARDLAGRVFAEDLPGAIDAADDVARFADGAVEDLRRATVLVERSFLDAGVPFTVANSEVGHLRAPPPRRTSNAPYGWRLCRGVVVASPGEQRVLTRLAGLVADRKQPAAIARVLNAEGYRTRHRHPWSRQAVYSMLRRQRRKKKAPASDAKAGTS